MNDNDYRKEFLLLLFKRTKTTMTYTKFLSRTTTAATTTTIANNITPTYYAKKVVVLVRTKILFAVLFVSIFWIVHVVDSQQQQQQDEKKDDDDVVVVDDKDDNNNDDHIVQCGVWLAPSTIVGAGLGMFAGKDFMEHDEILPSGDSMVAIVDIELHRANNPEWDQTLPFLWDEYVWAHTLIPSREGFGTVSVASPGLGSAANSFLPLYNVEEGHSTKDATGLHRSRDPGVGSFSYYHNRISTAKSDIVIGQELFVTCTSFLLFCCFVVFCWLLFFCFYLFHFIYLCRTFQLLFFFFFI